MTDSRTDSPTMIDVINNVVRGALGAMRVIGIGTAAGYNTKTQSVTISSVVDFRHWDPETEKLVCYKPSPVSNCPVLHMSAGGFFSAMPVKDGDVGIILVSDRSTDEFLTTGNTNNEPKDPRRFNFQDAMFLPVGASFASPLQHTDDKNEHWVFGEDTPTGFRFEVGDGRLTMGTTTVELLAQISAGLGEASTAAIKTGSSTVATSLGPQPLLNAADIIAAGVQLATLKGLVDQIRGMW